MLKQQFIDVMTGKPWRDRACSFEAADCWGLVVLFYRHVLGIEIHQTPDYEAGSDFRTCFEGDVEFWSIAGRPVDCGIFIAYYGGEPKHVGLILDGQAFHSRGDSGRVRTDKLRTVEKVFTKVEFYEYAVNRSTESPRSTERAA